MSKIFNVFSSGGKEKKTEASDYIIDMERVPKHIAFIMDGNGRWAAKRGMPRTYGHKAGVETIRKVTEACVELGVEYITLYAFSTENWKRSSDEVDTLMNLLVQYLRNELQEFHKNNLRVIPIGNISELPEVCQEELYRAQEITKNNSGLTINLALNYGGRNEISKAVKDICNDVKNNNVEIENIDEKLVSEYMYTKESPDPELMIRTSGEQRLSNFLLWQLAYSELWFTDVYWPDFSEMHIKKAIYEFQNRDRRFGGAK